MQVWSNLLFILQILSAVAMIRSEEHTSELQSP